MCGRLESWAILRTRRRHAADLIAWLVKHATELAQSGPDGKTSYELKLGWMSALQHASRIRSESRGQGHFLGDLRGGSCIVRLRVRHARWCQSRHGDQAGVTETAGMWRCCCRWRGCRGTYRGQIEGASAFFFFRDTDASTHVLPFSCDDQSARQRSSSCVKIR